MLKIEFLLRLLGVSFMLLRIIWGRGEPLGVTPLKVRNQSRVVKWLWKLWCSDGYNLWIQIIKESLAIFSWHDLATTLVIDLSHCWNEIRRASLFLSNSCKINSRHQSLLISGMIFGFAMNLFAVLFHLFFRWQLIRSARYHLPLLCSILQFLIFIQPIISFRGGVYA